MSLVRWFRKYNRRVMAVVVIVLMVGFIGGSALSYIFKQGANKKETVATFANGRKITNYDLHYARRDLSILEALGISYFLQRQDISGLLLDQILFREKRIMPETIQYLQQLMQQKRYTITETDLAGLFSSDVPNTVLWILLTYETEQAGIGTTNDIVSNFLQAVLPRIFPGTSPAQHMQTLMQNQGVSQRDILTIVGKLLSIFQYTQTICSLEDITTSQLKHMASAERENVSAEFVQFRADDWLSRMDPNKEPDPQRMSDHFNRYRNLFGWEGQEENPLGFGYKLPDRVKLEYMVIELDKIRSIVDDPTAQELMQYYQRNLQTEFTTSVSSDPNDPNAPQIEQTQRYSEVADDVEIRVQTKKILTKAREIFKKAQYQTQLPIPSDQWDTFSYDQIRTIASDPNFSFPTIARKLSESYGIPIDCASTGLLSMADFQQDNVLRRLVIQGRSESTIPLVNIVFSFEPFHRSSLQSLTIQKPRLFETIGPAADRNTQQNNNVQNQIMALVRIVEAKPAEPAPGLDYQYDQTGIVLGQNNREPKIKRIREQVVNDLKQLDAYAMARTEAQRFLDQAKTGSWEQAVTQFNLDHGADPNTHTTPIVLRSQNRVFRRIDPAQLEQFKQYASNNPMAMQYLTSMIAEITMAEELYPRAIAEDQGQYPFLITSDSDQSIYGIHDLQVERLNLQDFTENKARLLMQTYHTKTQSLTATYLDPDHILSRLNFSWKSKPNSSQPTQDGNTATEE